MGAGALGQAVDDFNGDNFDHGPHGFIGGGYIALWTTGGRPILQQPGAGRHAEVGQRLEEGAWPRTTSSRVSIATHGSVMSYRDAYLDLDPTYRDVYGNPLLRLTFDFHDNEIRMSKFLTDKAAMIAKAMKPRSMHVKQRKPPLLDRALPDHAQHRRRDHGHRSAHQRGQPLPAGVGRAERVRDGRIGVSAERRLQPDRHRGRADVLGRGRDPQPVPAKSPGR